MASSSSESMKKGKKLRGTFGNSQKVKLLSIDNRTLSSSTCSDFRAGSDAFEEEDDDDSNNQGRRRPTNALPSSSSPPEKTKDSHMNSSIAKASSINLKKFQLLAVDPEEAERFLLSRNFTNLIHTQHPQSQSPLHKTHCVENRKIKFSRQPQSPRGYYCDDDEDDQDDYEEEEISIGLPSDIPSGLVDIEGNIIGDISVRFGQDDDELSSFDGNSGSSNNYQSQKYSWSNPNKSSSRSESSQPAGSKHNTQFSYSPHSQQKDSRIFNSANKFSMSNKRTNRNSCNNNPASPSSCCENNTQFNTNTTGAVTNCGNHHQTADEEEHSISNISFSAGEACEPINSISNGNVLTSNLIVNDANHNNSHYHHHLGNQIIPNDILRRNNNKNFARFPRSVHAHAPVDRNNSTSAASNQSNTITVHYYPEGGWGYVVLVMAFFCHSILCGVHLSTGVVVWNILDKFGSELRLESGWLGAVSVGISLLLSPVWVSICKRKSTRLAAVFGGLVASLGCLFTSFASQFHQLFLSYGVFMGVGVGLTRDASSLMVGQYFKRKRELVEIVVVSGSGLGILLMSISIQTAISSFGWRLGLQAVTGSLFLTFFLGTCYRSASLYHPQRRAILHLKNQKRKVKEKEKRDDKPPFIDYSCLRSKTLQILLLSSAFTSYGIYTPLFSLAMECADEGFDDHSLVLLHVYVGASWIIGCCLFGLIVIQKNQDCRVSKQYLCQVASVICGISMVALTSVKGLSGMVIFAWVYGFSLGGYSYALKVYTYERVRARHFPRAWSFLQCSQAIPLFFGVPLTGYINVHVGWKSGYYMSALAVFIGSACLFLTDVRRRRLSRRKSANSSMKTCETTDGTQSPKAKRLSFAFPVEQISPQSKHESDEEDEQGGGAVDPSVMIKELTCISEEGIADMDFQDIYFDEWAEYLGECITSCNKVENCLASEYDPDYAVLVERRARRWSAARQSLAAAAHAGGANASSSMTNPNQLAVGFQSTSLNPKQLHPFMDGRSQHVGSSREGTVFRSHPKGSRVLPPRSITPIDEDSV